MNSSADRFLRAPAVAHWAAAFGSGRDPGEYDEFLATLRGLLRTIDAAGFEGGPTARFRPRLLADGTVFLLR
ncbi:hypothetical protein [Streptomyces sp. MST-110588]|uniref:hypothetical protein n=1 Tax=Streptomyces sp. MST-110588 TaxID=2833628 RepID=UPI001F5C39C7|nr:hypothetical protein [Streptomyces sp. MST-110588]UNO43385.1 hypothetical protein KGS77_32775 [Streptomyces sp. MST-110588]